MSTPELDHFAADLDGTVLVEASAGTGKTYAIEMLYLRLLLERGMDPEQIVVVTYTNAAAAELRQRVRARVRAAHEFLAGDAEASEPWMQYLEQRPDRDAAIKQLLTALFGFDRASISTIHGFCQRVLVEHAFDSGATFDLQMTADQTPIVDEVVRDFVAARLVTAPRALAAAVWGQGALQGMERFAALVAAQPELDVVPQAEAPSDTFEEWRRELEAARTLWRQRREEICALRVDERVLKKPSRMDRATVVAGLDTAFADGDYFASKRWPDLYKITAEYLEQATLKKHKAETPTHPFFDSCQRLCDLERELESAFRASLFGELADYARGELPRRKLQRGVAYFDDLLVELRAALRSDRGTQLASKLRARFGAALIDEFQDTDPVQYEIFRRAFAEGGLPLILIGDPKQSIYSFRGADVRTYVAAGREAKQRYTLNTNRRSSDRLVAGVNQLFAVENAFLVDGIDFAPALPSEKVAEIGGDPGGLAILRCEAPEAPPRERSGGGPYRRAILRALPTRIVSLLDGPATIDDRGVRAGDIAVLCRTNAEAAELQVELRNRGVPTVLHGDRSVFEAPEAEEMSRVLRALVDPRDAAAVRSALCTGLCGRNGDDLLRIEAEEAEEEWQGWIDRFDAWRERWLDHGFMSAFRALIDHCESTDRLLRIDGGERRLTNYLHIAELLQVASRRLRAGPLGLLDWLTLMSSDASARGEMAAEDVQIRLESDEDAVILTTIHKSKGLQYPIVFVPYLWNSSARGGRSDWFRVFASAENRRAVYVDAPLPDEIKNTAALDQMAEDMRLAYVALTRAQRACFVFTTDYAADNPEKSPIGRLLAERLSDGPPRDGDAIRFEPLPEGEPSLSVDGDRGPRLSPPPAPPEIRRGWRVSSFSGLTRRAEELASEEEEGLDRDAVEEAPIARSLDEAAEVPLADLGAGPRFGVMVHSVLENIDFAAVDVEVVGETARRYAVGQRLGSSQLEVLTDALAEIVRAPLLGDAPELSLAAVDRAHRLDELEFILPVAPNGAKRLDPVRLAEVLARHPDAVEPTYVERVGRLDFKAFAGFLRGFVDLVFEHAGRWYVVDYKSNFLGRSWGDYAPRRLAASMHEHDYYLQYLLYVVAVDRYLRLRQPGYDYETGFGGALYLFLRGMTPRLAGNGVFHDRPPARLIAELSSLFAGGDAHG